MHCGRAYLTNSFLEGLFDKFVFGRACLTSSFFCCLIFVIFQSVFGQVGVILKKQEEPTFDLVFGQVGVTLKKQQEPTFDLVFGQF